MKRSDYYRYCSTLRVSGTVVFPHRKDLIEFLSMHVSKLYQDWTNDQMSLESDPAIKREWAVRECTEGRLAEIYSSEFLEEHVVHENDALYRLSTKALKRVPKMFKVFIDMKDHKDLYESVLRRIAQGDKAADVFPDTEYVIEGFNKLVEVSP